DRQRAVADGVPHAAPRLRLVGAAAEPAPGGELGDVLERLTEAVRSVAPQLQLTQSRRVDHENAGWDDDSLALRRRVPPAVVTLADLLGLEVFDAEHAVRERGLPD